jgi:hypothetical protein
MTAGGAAFNCEDATIEQIQRCVKDLAMAGGVCQQITRYATTVEIGSWTFSTHADLKAAICRTLSTNGHCTPSPPVPCDRRWRSHAARPSSP